MPATLTAAACLLAVIAIGGCTSSAHHGIDGEGVSSSAPGHGSLTDREFNVAVAVARAEIAKYRATVTSATATVGVGTVTDPNAGPPCTSGTLLHIKLIGTFPTIGIGLLPTPGAPSASSDYNLMTVLVTADPESGKACDISVRIDPPTPDPGATLLFATVPPGHGSLTDAQFKVAVAVARAEVAKDAATITSATATIGAGTETEANVGPPCTSGTLLHIKLIGTFPHTILGASPTDDASGEGNDYSVSAELITADPVSGKACLLSVQGGLVTPDPGATLLFTH